MQQALTKQQQERFRRDAESMSDAELAKKYKISKRTAVNWRVRLCGPRKT